MDGPRFDALTRSVATSRRGALKAVLGAAVGTVFAARAGSDAGAKTEKVAVCHRTGSAKNPYTYILVPDNPNGPHSKHEGDVVGVDLKTNPDHCGACGNACDDGDPCTNNTCVDGRCAFPAKDCSRENDACNVGICRVVAGAATCIKQPANEGADCEAGKACCGGACKSAQGKRCSTDDECCGACSPEGVCCKSGVSCHEACCASPGAKCAQGGRQCCETGVVCANGDCCGDGKTCSPEGVCCASGVSCHEACCASPGAKCAQGGRQCCETGVVCANGACCPNATDVCDQNDVCTRG